jgi:hypothetical protein
MPRIHSISTHKAQVYETGADFCRFCTDNLENLHLLSFLLTADETKAENSFVSGFEDCVEPNDVFRDWAHSWARRTIVRNAVRMLTPRRNRGTANAVSSNSICCTIGRMPQASGVIVSILALEDFERFVFVLSVLRRYSDQDCSVLLECSRQDVRDARIRALQQLAESHRKCTVGGSELDASDSTCNDATDCCHRVK